MKRQTRAVMARVLISTAVMVSLLPGCKKEEPPAQETTRAYATTTYTQPETTKDQSAPLLTDISQEAGVLFEHYTGAFGKKWMPETMGSGGGFLDYDGDGDADIFLVNGSDWPGHVQQSPQPTMKLFRNQGDGTFDDVTVEAGLALTCYGMGVTFADYDGDGDVDIYVTAVGDNLLLRNDGGRFTNVTKSARVVGNDPKPGAPPSWSTGATWVDVDRDGRLDLFVANYVKWTPATDIFTTFDGKHKGYATPQQYDGESCRLYRNVDGKRFEDITDRAGVLNHDGKSLGVVVADFNDDGWPDLFVTNDTQPNFLYLNNKDGTFEDTAMMAGCGYDEVGRARAGMGADVADVGNDGILSIAIGNFTGESLSLYTQVEDGLFEDLAGKTRLSRPSLQPLTFSVLFADLDLDGHNDLVTANGHIEPEINRVQKETTFAQRPQLFLSDGAGKFIDVSDQAGDPFAQPVVGRGIASADIDNDGDLDLLLTVNGGAAKLLRNDTPHGAKKWIKLRLVGSGMNTGAIGAKITAYAGELVQRRMIRAGNAYLSQSDTTIVLGLGEADALDRIIIEWPNGQREERPGPFNAGAIHIVIGCEDCPSAKQDRKS